MKLLEFVTTQMNKGGCMKYLWLVGLVACMGCQAHRSIYLYPGQEINVSSGVDLYVTLEKDGITITTEELQPSSDYLILGEPISDEETDTQ